MKSKLAFAVFLLVLAFAGNAFAVLAPTDVDFAGVAVTISAWVLAAVTAGMTLWGGYIGLKAALSVFTSLVSKAFGK